MTPPGQRPLTTASGRPAPRNRFQLVVRQAAQFATGAAAVLALVLGLVLVLSVLGAVRRRVRR